MKALYAAIRDRGPLTVRGVHWGSLEAAVKEHAPVWDTLCVKMRRWKNPVENDLPPYSVGEFIEAGDKDMLFFRRDRGELRRPWPGRFPATNAVFNNDRTQVIGLTTSEWRETTFGCEGMLVTLHCAKRSYDDYHSEAVETSCNVYWHFATIPDQCSCKRCHPD